MSTPSKRNPEKLHRHKCFNCKQSPEYYFDDTQGENCSSCTDNELCDDCSVDLKYPHVVVHENTHCPFGYETHQVSKSEAVADWKSNNEKKR